MLGLGFRVLGLWDMLGLGFRVLGLWDMLKIALIGLKRILHNY